MAPNRRMIDDLGVEENVPRYEWIDEYQTQGFR